MTKKRPLKPAEDLLILSQSARCPSVDQSYRSECSCSALVFRCKQAGLELVPDKQFSVRLAGVGIW